MAEVHLGPLPDGMKQCRICAEPINLRAIKCIHCGSVQGKWALRAGSSSTFLALLIALFSVLATAVPAIKGALTPDDSKLIFSFPTADQNRLALFVSNNGVRPGMIEQIFFKTVKTGAAFLRPIGQEQHAVYIIEPGKSVLFEFAKPKDSEWVPDTGMIKYPKCELAVTYVNFTGFHDVDLFACPAGTKFFMSDNSLD